MPDLREEYLLQAEECRRQAAGAFHPGDKAEWLRLTDAWLRMAGEAVPTKSVPGARPSPRCK